MNRYVAILAGGIGTRLWPLSRSRQPKQLVPLLGDRSLVQATIDRLAPSIPYDRIVVVTEQSHAEALREQLPELPAANVLVEPVRRGTAAAVGLAAQWIAHQDPHATMASLHADHAIRDAQDFRVCLAAAFTLAESGPWLVTLGIRPASPHTGMGYIQPGEALGTFGGRQAFRAVRFVEKPDRAAAEGFLQEGYFWNPGYFIFQVQTILNSFALLLPEIHDPLSTIGSALGTPAQDTVLLDQYPKLRVETIDYGIMERADQLATVPADFGWSDIGSWAEVWEMSSKDADGNASRGIHAAVDCTDLLVLGSDKPVVTLGVHDLTVVDLQDVLLICPRDRAQEVKLLVEQLQTDPRFADLL